MYSSEDSQKHMYIYGWGCSLCGVDCKETRMAKLLRMTIFEEAWKQHQRQRNYWVLG